MISHTNLLYNERMMQAAFQHTDDVIFVNWLPFYHDMGLIGNVILPLYISAPCILMSPLSFLQKPVRWLQAISHYKATISGGPNFAYDLCARKITPEQRATLDLNSWDIAFNGAEPVRRETLERFATTFESCGFRRESFYPCYGLAEATLIVSGGLREAAPVTHAVQGSKLEHHRVVAASIEEKGNRALVGCGHTWLDQKIVIVDPESLTLCPPHRVGEIWVSGPSVARGYWNNPEETERTFQAYLADTGEGPFLRTGDLGFLQDGELFITGRLKDLIIIRGRNYYPQDIELTVEQSHPALRPGCGAAFSVEVTDEERLVIVQEVKRRYRNPDVDEVARAIRGAVAERYELQVYAVILIKTGSISKTTSGKIQRHASRERFLSDDLNIVGSSILDDTYFEQREDDLIGLESAFAIPRTPTEEMLAEIWSEVLGLEQVGIYENFFALGGHSLQATQVISRVRELFQVELPLRTLFESPTLVGLAESVEAARRGAQAVQVPSILPIPRENLLPLSFSQERMWFLYQFEPNNTAYHIPLAVRLTGPLDVPVLQQSVNEIVRRHEILRTTFANKNGPPVQVIAPNLTLTLPVIDLREFPPSEREAEARRLVTTEAQRPFDIARGPLFRITLFRLEAEEYVVLVVMHHIVSDAWSLSLLWQEITSLYEAFSAGKSISLPELLIQYADFAHWQRQWLQGEVLETQLAYWKQQLAGAPSVLELPADRPRPATQTLRGASQSFPLPESLVEALRTLSRQEGATLFMTLLAAFKALLYRYTGQADILIGTPIANRHWLAVEGLMGTLVNTLVMRTDLSGNPTFRELLSRVREVALEAYAHQELPFEQLVEALQPERALSHSPLVQVMFNVTNPPMPIVQIPNLSWSIFEFDRGAAQFDLTLSFLDTKQIQMMAVEYNTELFDHATISRMMGHLRVLLEGIVATGAELRLSDLPLLTEAEQRQLLVEWNNLEVTGDAPVDLSLDSCVHQLFEAQVERTPDAIAVVFESQRLTYRELNRQANSLAHYLQELGVGPDECVGICMERSLDMVIGLLGILKAGGTYVPLDPTYPKQRLDFMLKDSQTSVLLTQQRLSNTLSEHEARVVCTDADWETIAERGEENPDSSVSSESLAYVIYTSGSTGAPKGVEIPHRAAVNFLHAMQQEPGLTGQDTMLAVTTLSFDIAVLELFLPIITGARVVVVSREVASDGARLIEALTNSGATIMQATPATWRLLLEAGWQGMDRLKMLCGGEALPQELANQLLERGACLWNMYGPTETTVWSVVHKVEPEDRPVPIGHPIANTQIYILDRNLQPAPIGVPGELHIGGVGLARGYHNRPELTKEKFIPNPFIKDEGGGVKDEDKTYPLDEMLILHPLLSKASLLTLYKTGDLARYLPDGNLEFLGRIDHQVKLRGFRIELGEIEAVLSQYPAVQQSIVVARESEHRPGDTRLVAYVVPDQEETPTTNDLCNFLKQKLPDYMVPATFVVLDTLPLTPNGKVNRRALPTPDPVRPDLAETFVAPGSYVEEILAGIWAQVLGIDQIGVYDNFFELGGHSLLVTQVMTRVCEAFQVELPLRSFFEAPTIAALALVIEESLIAEIDDLTEDQAQRLVESVE
jgi:amino acid adenylation domain-containing protein